MKRAALISSLLTWAAFSLAWLCIIIIRSYLQYGEVNLTTQMLALPPAVLPLVLALPAIVILGAERLVGNRGTALSILLGACTSALQALLILQVSRDDPIFAGYSWPLVIAANLVPGASWAFFYRWFASHRQI